ncbi:hypothetical protein ROZALSC1DRAFT_21875 [Rozella allomycis CSF55]|uniref:F-box domain-containing protein n=1 Tax=Rozella allomycis (strain CSF55) TaxID=988480 RepID=A0A4V1J008_ROZAC|nr:hypothetical protein ROZALSC1DRAFT_21875 [Rozella allomycis CSF55]
MRFHIFFCYLSVLFAAKFTDIPEEVRENISAFDCLKKEDLKNLRFTCRSFRHFPLSPVCASSLIQYYDDPKNTVTRQFLENMKFVYQRRFSNYLTSLFVFGHNHLHKDHFIHMIMQRKEKKWHKFQSITRDFKSLIDLVDGYYLNETPDFAEKFRALKYKINSDIDQLLSSKAPLDSKLMTIELLKDDIRKIKVFSVNDVNYLLFLAIYEHLEIHDSEFYENDLDIIKFFDIIKRYGHDKFLSPLANGIAFTAYATFMFTVLLKHLGPLFSSVILEGCLFWAFKFLEAKRGVLIHSNGQRFRNRVPFNERVSVVPLSDFVNPVSLPEH